MKKNSKKRVLLSSVAMLMVATVSLGSATYAWFTQNTTATASGIDIRTSKTSSLLIADDTIDYTTAFSYQDVQAVMLPSSSINGTNWYSTAADKADSYASTSTPTTVDMKSQGNKYVFVDQLNIKNDGEVAVKDVSITVSGFNGHNYLRFALVPVSSQGTNKAVTEANFRANVYGLDTTAYNPVKPTSTTDTTGAYSTAQDDKITPKAVGPKSLKIDIADIEAGAEVHYNLYVWFEGQDTDCYDEKAGTGADNLTFVVEGTPVSEA